MISSVSSVSFRGEADNKDLNSLISQPGKYAASPAGAQQAPEGDKVDLSTPQNKEKSNTGAIIGGVIGALALAWIGLGFAVGKGKLSKVEAPDGIGQKAKNFFHTIGKSAVDAYDATLGKWFGKKAGEAAEDAAKAGSEAASGAADAGEAAAKS